MISHGNTTLRYALFGLLLFLTLGASRVQAQTPSPLAGKTVHVFNPFGPSLPLINLSGTGYKMTAESGNWYFLSFDSLGGSLQPWMNAFGIRTDDWKYLGPTGIGVDGSFSVDLFGTSKEIWIVVDPAGPSTAAPLVLTTAPRTIFFFNPWPVTGAEVVLDGTKRAMMSDRAHCGWDVMYLLTPGPVTGYFVNSADGETYGKAGLKDPTPIDFTALFAAHGSAVWIGGATGTSGTFPGDKGSCNYLMATTVHDMAESHPDFGNTRATVGMVQADLGPDRKPVATSNAPTYLNSWFKSDSTAAAPLKGAQTCLDLEMGKSDDGLWEYDSKYDPVSQQFFPIDHWNLLDKNSTCSNEATPPQSTIHNYGFCLESHASFVYKKGQVFDFRGDDDVWVFINNKLALDLGGIHGPLDGRINLDTLGLTEGKSYPWDFFFCERNKCGSSLRIKTTIYFKQQRALDHAEEKLPGGGTGYRVIKRIGGTGACGSSGDSITEVPPGPITFVLYRSGNDTVQTLAKGVSYGGITVGDAGVSLDTSKVTGLPPGTYRIVFFETSNPNLRDEIRFTITAAKMVLFEAPLSQTAKLGDAIRVTAGNYFRGHGKDSLVAEAVTWTPTFPSHLSVYADSSRATRIASGTRLTTAPTGLDTLWVFGDSAAQEDKTDSLSISGSNRTKVTFTLPPLDLPRAVSAAVFDEDGDGRGDRLQVVYDRDITGNLPISLAYQWPKSEVAVSVTDLASHFREGKTLVFKGQPLSNAILTAGTGTVASTY
ncbi:MAG TPA: fibro-slime domain-containing protein, partial [Fibrobacteria bacterium]|nr:fibro-slime domain-containing protein [Fibrobacteria bacterium]